MPTQYALKHDLNQRAILRLMDKFNSPIDYSAANCPNESITLSKENLPNNANKTSLKI